jgi:hypothetical protein
MSPFVTLIIPTLSLFQLLTMNGLILMIALSLSNVNACIPKVSVAKGSVEKRNLDITGTPPLNRNNHLTEGELK